MDLITESEAMALFAPHHPSLFQAIDVAWETWTTKQLPEVPLFNPHTQASFIHDVGERELRTRLGSASGVRMAKPNSSRFWVHFEQANVLLRIKKLTTGGVANYPTNTAVAFNGQQALATVPAGPRVTLGYRLTPNNDKMLGVFLALLKGNRVMWQYQLSRDASGIVSIVSPPPSLPLPAVQLKLKGKSSADSEGNAP